MTIKQKAILGTLIANLIGWLLIFMGFRTRVPFLSYTVFLQMINLMILINIVAAIGWSVVCWREIFPHQQASPQGSSYTQRWDTEWNELKKDPSLREMYRKASGLDKE
jgi:hypothetical protein